MFLLATALISLFVHNAHSYCLPCPNFKTASKVVECDCAFGEFYDQEIGKCVTYNDCPKSDIWKGVEELKQLYPVIAQLFNSTLQSIPPPKMPEDYDITMQAFNKRFDKMEKDLPKLLGPILGPIVLQHKDILETCGTKISCVLTELLRKKESFNVLIPKLKPISYTLIKQLLMAFDDLEKLAEEKQCNFFSNCPLVKGITTVRNHLPGIDDLHDMFKVLQRTTKYTLGDMYTNLWGSYSKELSKHN